jgi:hypothetical protein
MDGKDYDEVDYETNTISTSRFYLDSTSLSTLTTIYLVVALAVFGHCYVASNSPPLSSSKEEIIALNTTLDSDTAALNITIGDLESRHRVLSLNCRFVASTRTIKNAFPLTLSANISGVRNGQPVTEPTRLYEERNVAFHRGSNLTDPIEIASSEVSTCDSFKIHLMIQAELSLISAVVFHYDFANPDAIRYEQMNRLFLGILIGYGLFVSLRFLRVGPEAFCHKFLVLLGVAGLLSANPLFTLLPAVCDHLSTAIFVSLFRMFVILQLEFIRTREPVFSVSFLGFLSLVFLGYAGVDSSASLAALERVETVSDQEVYRMYLDAAYICVSLLYLVVTVVTFDPVHLRRLILMSLLLFATSCVTIATHVCCVLMDLEVGETFPVHVFRAVHGTLAATVLFLMHSDAGVVYKGIDEEAGSVDGLELERASSAGEEDGFEGVLPSVHVSAE